MFYSEYPNFPKLQFRDEEKKKFLANTVKSGLPIPKDEKALSVGIRRVKEENGFTYAVIFPGVCEFTDGEQKQLVAFTFFFLW